MRYAIRFNTTSWGDIISYSVLPYLNFLTIKNAGFKVHLTGFVQQTDAELMANSFVGLNLNEPMVELRLQFNGISPLPKFVESPQQPTYQQRLVKRHDGAASAWPRKDEPQPAAQPDRRYPLRDNVHWSPSMPNTTGPVPTFGDDPSPDAAH